MSESIRDQLLDVMAKVDRPGTFCASGLLPSALPGLEVAGMGVVALPLEKRQAAVLKKQAHQAPYGKGTRTLVDTDVRRVWEIDVDQVVLTNPQWGDVVGQAVAAARSELGLEDQKLEAHLYKLLLYEPGSFFLAHRDGEKLDRMVATLVIALPSAHKGGELIVRHEGREQVVDFSPESKFQTQFAAFYADCEHEVRPVSSGFRLALVYNLTLVKSKRTITAPTSREQIAAAARLLRQWSGKKRTASDSPSKLAVVLDHQYTQTGLTRDALKGIDRARADVLFAAAGEAGCDASLALVTYWESGSAEPSGDYGYGYGRSRRRGWRYDDFGDEYDDEDGGEDRGEYEMEEVFESSLTAKHFSDAEGNPLDFGQIPLDEDEIVSKQPLNKGKPDKEDFEGYTGNEGMTLDRWYRRAAVVLWPAESRFDMLCEAGVEAAVGGLDPMVRRWKQARKSREREALGKECLEFASRIIARWPERKSTADPGVFDFGRYAPGNFDDDDGAGVDPGGPGGGLNAGKTSRRPLLFLLDELGDASLIAAWIRGVLAKDASIDPGKTLGDVCEQYGWATFQKELLKLFEETPHQTLERQARLLADWSSRKDKSKSDDRVKLCAQLAERIMSAVERWNPSRVKRDWMTRPVNPGELLPSLTQAFLTLEKADLFERLVAYVLDRPKDFDLTTVQVPVLLGLAGWLKRNVKQPSPPLDHWLKAVAAELDSRAANPPREPGDWRRQSATGCKCADCKVLSRFLNDPGEQTFRLPLVESRRRHLHQTIDDKQLDTTHVTERRGRPYTLVLTKTKASYERSLKAHHLDLDQLAKIQKLLDWHGGLKAAPARPKAHRGKQEKR